MGGGPGIGARKEGASWRGNARRDGDSFALSFHPNGIMDFVTREGYSPVDIVARIADIKPHDAMRRLREKLGLYVEPELPPVRFTFRKGSAWETLARGAPEAGGGAEEQPERKAIDSAKAWAEAKAPLAGFMFDGDIAPEPSPMLIKRMLPAQGICFNGGQSGVGKTFLMCHAAACLGAGKSFFGYRVHERVGSAIFAAEGAFTMPNRIAVARQRITTALKLPISWLGNVPNLSDPRQIDAMIPRLKALSVRFGDDFRVRLGAIWLDTLSAACDIQDEDDNSEAAKVGRQLQRLAAATGTVVVPSHHYGKNQDTGLRGASAWRALCDVVWSAIGERNHLTGDIKNRRLALAKSRDDEEGVISVFDIKFAELGRDKYGDPFGACYVVEESLDRDERPGRKKSSDAEMLERAILETYDRLADEVSTSRGFNGKLVREVSTRKLMDQLRSRGFLESGDDGAITSSGRGKFHRAKTALLTAQTLIENEGMIWR
jgi:hypothetical protein